MNSHSLTAERASTLLTYDPDSGEMKWKVQRGNAYPPGTRCGSICRTGHGYMCLVVKVDGKTYKLARLAWLINYGKWPVGQIDHIDLNPLNNAISNLRECTASQNCANRRYRSGATSGFKGVTYRKRERRWCAQVRSGGKLMYWKLFTTKEEAAEAYIKASSEIHGQFARAA